MGEVIPLTAAIMAHRERQKPRFKPVNGVEEKRAQNKASLSEFSKKALISDNIRIMMSGQEARQRDNDMAMRAYKHQERLRSDNIRRMSIRPWKPEDDDDGNAA